MRWMKTWCCSVVLVLQISSSSGSTAAETNATDQPIAGYGFELMMAKLDYLQYKLLELEFGLKERDEETTERLVNLEALFSWAGHNLTALHEQSRKILAQQTACASHEQMRKDILQLAPKQGLSKNAQLLLSLQALQRKEPVQSCSEVPLKESGVYSIKLGEGSFKAYCEQSSFGGGWLVIQYRFDGSVDFFRSWAEYRDGFGSVYQEFWIGLERLHQLTSRGSYELMVEIKDFDGTYRYARYNAFVIGSEAEQYSLKVLGTYDGTVGDSLKHHEGGKFTTKDRDNDGSESSNCATTYEGAWWYKNCHASNLNGKYWNKDDSKSMCWHSYKNNYQGLAYSRMMIRER